MDTLAVQTALAKLGYALVLDGKMGPQSRVAVQTFQRGRGLAADGIVGPQTIKALQAATAERTEPRAAPAPPVSLNSGGTAAPAHPVFAQPRATRRISEIIIHCTATPEGRDVSVETIRGWHIDQGWKDIGYHWIIMLDGTVKPGRAEAQIGSHVAGHNTGTLGVVYVGGVASDGRTPKDTRSPEQKAALMAHVKALIARYPTIKKITGHNQYAAKACPSFDVRKDDLGRVL